MPLPVPVVPTSSIGNIIICVPPFLVCSLFILPFWFRLLAFFSFDLMFSAVIPLRQQPTSAHCGGTGAILLLCWVWARNKRFISVIWQWDKAFDVKLSGVSSLSTGMFVLLVTAFRYRGKTGFFAVIPGFQACALPSRALRDNGQKLWFQTCTSHVLAHPLLSHPLQFCRGLFTLPSNH